MFGSAHNDIADETDIDLVVQFVPGQRALFGCYPFKTDCRW